MAEKSRYPHAIGMGLVSAMDRVPWRPIHTRLVLVLGLGWMLDAFEVTIIGNVLSILQKLWEVTAEQASLLVTVWLVGIMFGAIFFGYLSDRFGRRRLFILTLLLYSTFTVASALSPGYGAFLVFRFLTAIGVGAEYSAINAAIVEFIPARYCGRAAATVMNFWPLGAILAGVITLYFVNALPPSIGWRFAFALGAIIALFSLWARRVLPESPRWLSGRGRHEEAARVLTEITGEAPMAGIGDAAYTVTLSTGFLSQFSDLLRFDLGRLALGCALDFSEAAGYYGVFALLPIVVLPRLNIPDEAVPWFFIIGNVGGAIGGVLAALLLDVSGRKATVIGFYLFAACSMLVLGAAAAAGNSAAVLLAFTLANLGATGSWISAYPTFSELFPTRRRATGIGVSVAFGRIGAALAPPVLVAVAERASIMAAFWVLAACWVLGAAAMIPWSIWGVEGRGKSLEVLAGP